MALWKLDIYVYPPMYGLPKSEHNHLIKIEQEVEASALLRKRGTKRMTWRKI